MRLEMGQNWPRALGEGVVLDRVTVPSRVVPMKVLHPPHGTAAVLHRSLTLRERIRSLLR
jgi:hypothetical protein